jgi:hypothetical protein
MLIDQYFSHFYDEYKFTNINPGKKGGTCTGMVLRMDILIENSLSTLRVKIICLGKLSGQQLSYIFVTNCWNYVLLQAIYLLV